MLDQGVSSGSGIAGDHIDGWSQLRIAISPDHTSCTTITLAGEIDLATLPALRENLDTAHSDGHHTVELRLGEVSFMCAGALTLFRHTHATLAQAGGKLVLVDATPMVRRMLTISGLDSELNVR